MGNTIGSGNNKMSSALQKNILGNKPKSRAISSGNKMLGNSILKKPTGVKPKYRAFSSGNNTLGNAYKSLRPLRTYCTTPTLRDGSSAANVQNSFSPNYISLVKNELNEKIKFNLFNGQGTKGGCYNIKENRSFLLAYGSSSRGGENASGIQEKFNFLGESNYRPAKCMDIYC